MRKNVEYERHGAGTRPDHGRPDGRGGDSRDPRFPAIVVTTTSWLQLLTVWGALYMLPSNLPAFSYFQWHLLVQLGAVAVTLVPVVYTAVLDHSLGGQMVAMQVLANTAVLSLTQGYDANAFYFVNLRLVLVPACVLYLASAVTALTICFVQEGRSKIV